MSAYQWGRVWPSPNDTRVAKAARAAATEMVQTHTTEALQDATPIIVAAGYKHTLFVTSGGHLFSTGSNAEGQLGRATNVITPAAQPGLVKDLLAKGETVIACAAGATMSAAVTTDGDIYMWGSLFQPRVSLPGEGYNSSANNNTQALVGLSDRLDRNEYLRRIVMRSEAAYLANKPIANVRDGVALQFSDGPAEVEGVGKGVRTKNSSNSSSASPGSDTADVNILKMKVTRIKVSRPQKMAITLAPPLMQQSPHFVGIAAGYAHALAWDSQGRLFALGYNDRGQLGTGNRITATTFILVSSFLSSSLSSSSSSSASASSASASGSSATPYEIIVKAACGQQHSAAITSTGKCYTWGSGALGQLGHNDTHDQLSPTLITRLVWGEGNNTSPLNSTGANNNSNTLSSSSSSSSSYVHQIVDISCGAVHTLAATRAGLCVFWGSAEYGQAGDRGDGAGGDLAHSSRFYHVPRVIESLRKYRVVQVSCGGQFSIALFANGVAVSWGWDAYHCLGHGLDKTFGGPFERVAGLQGRTVIGISSGYHHAAAVVAPEGNPFAASWGTLFKAANADVEMEQQQQQQQQEQKGKPESRWSLNNASGFSSPTKSTSSYRRNTNNNKNIMAGVGDAITTTDDGEIFSHDAWSSAADLEGYEAEENTTTTTTTTTTSMSSGGGAKSNIKGFGTHFNIASAILRCAPADAVLIGSAPGAITNKGGTGGGSGGGGSKANFNDSTVVIAGLQLQQQQEGHVGAGGQSELSSSVSSSSASSTSTATFAASSGKVGNAAIPSKDSDTRALRAALADAVAQIALKRNAIRAAKTEKNDVEAEILPGSTSMTGAMPVASMNTSNTTVLVEEVPVFSHAFLLASRCPVLAKAMQQAQEQYHLAAAAAAAQQQQQSSSSSSSVKISGGGAYPEIEIMYTPTPTTSIGQSLPLSSHTGKGAFRLHFPGVRRVVLTAITNYLYSDSLTAVPSHRLPSLRKLGEALGLVRLVTLCEKLAHAYDVEAPLGEEPFSSMSFGGGWGGFNGTMGDRSNSRREVKLLSQWYKYKAKSSSSSSSSSPSKKGITGNEEEHEQENEDAFRDDTIPEDSTFEHDMKQAYAQSFFSDVIVEIPEQQAEEVDVMTSLAASLQKDTGDTSSPSSSSSSQQRHHDVTPAPTSPVVMRSYHLHKLVLCRYEYFRTMLTGGFAESARVIASPSSSSSSPSSSLSSSSSLNNNNNTMLTIRLEDIDADGFEEILAFMYSGDMTAFFKGDADSCIRTLGLASRFCITDLVNKGQDLLILKLEAPSSSSSSSSTVTEIESCIDIAETLGLQRLLKYAKSLSTSADGSGGGAGVGVGVG